MKKYKKYGSKKQNYDQYGRKMAFFRSQIAKVVMMVVMSYGHSISVKLFKNKIKFCIINPFVKLTSFCPLI